jgi:O-antigen/teichoic acid export membrane protein
MNLFAAAVLNIGLNLILVPMYGLMGAAISTLVAYTFAFVLTTIATRSYATSIFDWPFILKCIIATTWVGVWLTFIAPRGWLAIILNVVVCAAGYFMLLFIMRAFDKKEIAFAKNLLWATQTH